MKNKKHNKLKIRLLFIYEKTLFFKKSLFGVDSTFKFPITSNRNLTANFAPIAYTLSVSVNDSKDGTATASATFTYNQIVSIPAIANTGYNFVDWTENGTEGSKEVNYTFAITSKSVLVANFTTRTFTISASANDNSKGTVRRYYL